ncbi:DEAD/DEAH box helicase [Patescibacteria group bacterium]
MYRKFNNRHNGRNFSRFGGRRFGAGVRRIKSFDPTFIINAPRIENAPKEYAITHTFDDFQISEQLRKNVIQKGYNDPTPIQDQAIEPILEGRDLIGIANTGTGKTAAFLIPLIEKVLKNRSLKVLIVTPTRELASQIKDEFSSFSRGLGINCALCIGGAHMGRQIQDLRRSPNFVIGTPGRIEDLIRSRNLNLSSFSAVVLDEADRMVDTGFIHNIKYIVSLLPRNRQSLFFSATIGGKVKEILKDFVTNPVTVSVKSGDMIQNIRQDIVKVLGQEAKIEELQRLLVQREFEKVLIFGRTKYGVQKLSDNLRKRGFRTGAIHGNKNQNQRIRTLVDFKSNNIKVLIATDVASRGLDIPNVSHVINYDLPESYEVYIHRIGRTGRLDKKGVALTFVN